MGTLNTGAPVGGGDTTSVFSAFRSRIEKLSGEVSWAIPDAMSLKQIILTPFPLQSSSALPTTISFKLLIEDGTKTPDSDGLRPFKTRASLTYDDLAADTSPPPDDPVNPQISLGEVWDIGIVLLKNTRIQIKMVQTPPTNPGGDVWQCGLVGTWLRDIE